jgi:hypothetical protein
MKRLSLAYLVALFAAFAVVGGVSSLLYELNIGEYRRLSFWTGWVRADFGEFHARLFLFLSVLFIPSSVFVGLPGVYLLKRHDHTATRHFAGLGAGLGLVVGFLVSLIEGKPSWVLFGILLGVVWALVFRCITHCLPMGGGGAAPSVIQKKVSTTANLVHLSPLLFVISLCLPAMHIDGEGGNMLFGFHVFVLTLFFPVQSCGDFFACLLGVVANLAFLSSYTSFWLSQFSSQFSRWPLKFAILGTASALLSPAPVFGARLDSIGPGYVFWLCAHVLMVVLLLISPRNSAVMPSPRHPN